MTYDTPSFREDSISQIPALQLLQALGYKYLTPDEAVEARGGRLGNVLLEGILTEQLRKINKIRFKGNEYPFSEGSILSAVQALKELPYDGLIRTNEKVYDLLTLGKSLQQSIDGDIKSFPLKYIEWDPAKINDNVFHVTEEFSVERTGSYETRRPDIVLFVNGIPLCVIECKSPHIKDPIDQAISQQCRNQLDGEIPKLFIYSQLLMAVSKNEAMYATTGTPKKFWSKWKERENIEDIVRLLVNAANAWVDDDKLFSHPRTPADREFFEKLGEQNRETTAQDRALVSLCRPERLLELMFRYTLYDNNIKKIARYQQYFCVKKILDRIKTKDKDGSRQGGVVWHTQGSGKSLTMVMLAHGLALEPDIENYKIILVTDRIDLDDQIYRTFNHCGAEPVQARTGKHLSELIGGHREHIITTVIDKFEAAVGKHAVRNENPNIFVLVDEGHRGQYGPLHAKMRKVLPNACFIGFTGTPIMKKDKNTVDRFGGLIDTYTITEAVNDKAVVPLLYEGRHVDQTVDEESIDAWFDRYTEPLSDDQKADLKRKFSTTDQLNKTEQKVKRIAWDISIHYRDNWKGTPYKAQLVTQDKATALLYKRFLDEFDMVTSEILISGPDEREGHEDVYEDNPTEILAFWDRMMKQYGSEKEYNRSLINSFTHSEQPEIIIVVDKLLTGFDSPPNTVMYLTRKLKDHTLLQAIARVNRLHDGKEFGYIIDYRGVLEHLDSALELYGQMAEYDQEDLVGTLTDISEVVDKLPQRHSDVWELFNTIENKQDEEAYERLLVDEVLRTKFYERLSKFSRTLAIALASVKFIENTPEDKIDKYKADLKFFMRLRTAVRRRYAEVVDFKEYETKIQKLLDTHVGTGEVETITGMVNIFDSDAFAKEVEKLDGVASKADTIAYRTKKTISERMQEDPAFYKKFSKMLEDAIQAFREKRISDLEFLNKATFVQDSIRNRTSEDVPKKLQHHDVAIAFYGVLLETFSNYADENLDLDDLSADAGLAIDNIVSEMKIVNWVNNSDIQNQMMNRIEDYLFELKDTHGFELTFDDIDKLLELCLDIARVRYKA